MRLHPRSLSELPARRHPCRPPRPDRARRPIRPIAVATPRVPLRRDWVTSDGGLSGEPARHRAQPPRPVRTAQRGTDSRSRCHETAATDPARQVWKADSIVEGSASRAAQETRQCDTHDCATWEAHPPRRSADPMNGRDSTYRRDGATLVKVRSSVGRFDNRPHPPVPRASRSAGAARVSSRRSR